MTGSIPHEHSHARAHRINYHTSHPQNWYPVYYRLTPINLRALHNHYTRAHAHAHTLYSLDSAYGQSLYTEADKMAWLQRLHDVGVTNH